MCRLPELVSFGCDYHPHKGDAWRHCWARRWATTTVLSSFPFLTRVSSYRVGIYSNCRPITIVFPPGPCIRKVEHTRQSPKPVLLPKAAMLALQYLDSFGSSIVFVCYCYSSSCYSYSSYCYCSSSCYYLALCAGHPLQRLRSLSGAAGAKGRGHGGGESIRSLRLQTV